MASLKKELNVLMNQGRKHDADSSVWNFSAGECDRLYQPTVSRRQAGHRLT